MFQALTNNRFIEMSELFVKFHTLTKYESEIKLITDSLYFFLTTGRGMMTLGEEYVQIIPHEDGGHKVRKCSCFRDTISLNEMLSSSVKAQKFFSTFSLLCCHTF